LPLTLKLPNSGFPQWWGKFCSARPHLPHPAVPSIKATAGHGRVGTIGYVPCQTYGNKQDLVWPETIKAQRITSLVIPPAFIVALCELGSSYGSSNLFEPFTTL
jgi:hypothetical protein